ncbi:MAG: hypothetical protein HOV79_19335 [Hamadaea sp.]|nr:hypothetical protein [Hamadaea sp.]
MSNETVLVCLPAAESASPLADRLHAVMHPYDAELDPVAGKWDRWAVCGGFGRFLLPVKEGCEDDPRLVRSPVDMMGRARVPDPTRSDGGPMELMDFARDKRQSIEKNSRRWDAWYEIASQHPRARRLADVAATSHLVGDAFAAASLAFGRQPAIQALMQRDGIDESEMLWNDFNDPVRIYGYDRAEFLKRVAAKAVSLSALLQVDGRWISGEDFGAEHDLARWDRYDRHVDDYIGSLEPTDLVISVRIHS